MDSLNGSYDKGRSSSFGPGRGAGPGRGSTFRGTEFNAKTRLCNRWLSPEGCRFGDRCNFAHGEHELRSLPPRSPDGFQGGPPAAGGPPGPGRGGYAPRGRGGYGYGPGRGAGGRGVGAGRGGYGYASGGYGYGMGGGEGGYGGGDMGSGGGQGRGGMSEEAWAQSGYPTTGPNGWIMYKDKATGDSYYHNGRTGVTQWDRPTDWPA